METRNKKILKIATIVLVALAAFVLVGKILRREAGGAWPMRGWDGDRAKKGMSYPAPGDQYVFPYDADKTGKLAIKVGDMAAAASEVKDIAASQAGEIVFYELNNATSKLKNGIIVVKVPRGKFEEAFAAFKERSKLVVQESVTKNQDYPQVCPLAAAAETKPLSSDTNVGSELTIAPPLPCPQAQVREFSYIKVIFVADGKGVGIFGKDERRDFAATSVRTVGKWILVVLAIKSVLILLMTAFLAYLIIKFFQYLTGYKCKRCEFDEKKETKSKPLRKANKVEIVRKAGVAPRSRK